MIKKARIGEAEEVRMKNELYFKLIPAGYIKCPTIKREELASSSN